MYMNNCSNINTKIKLELVNTTKLKEKQREEKRK